MAVRVAPAPSPAAERKGRFMGWLYSKGQTRQDVIRRCTTGATDPQTGRVWTCIRHTAKGGVLWSVWTVQDKDGTEVDRFIGCDLIAAQRGYGWGYKGMTEAMGPYQASCPLAYLDMVPVVRCAGWREQVRAWHKGEAARHTAVRALRVGDRLRLAGCTVDAVTVESLRPLCGRDVGGKLWRIPQKYIAVA